MLGLTLKSTWTRSWIAIYISSNRTSTCRARLIRYSSATLAMVTITVKAGSKILHQRCRQSSNPTRKCSYTTIIKLRSSRALLKRLPISAKTCKMWRRRQPMQFTCKVQGISRWLIKAIGLWWKSTLCQRLITRTCCYLATVLTHMPKWTFNSRIVGCRKDRGLAIAPCRLCNKPREWEAEQLAANKGKQMVSLEARAI